MKRSIRMYLLVATALLMQNAFLVSALSPKVISSNRQLSVATERVPKTIQDPLSTFDEDAAADACAMGNDNLDLSKRAFLSSLVVSTVLLVSSSTPSWADTTIATSSSPMEQHIVTTTTTTTTTLPAVDYRAIFTKASKKALGGGKAGAAAAVVQVTALMWLRTAMNYQYVYGGNLSTSLQTLWDQGGIARLYQGLPFALIQGPLTRFGDTAANVGVLALLETQTDLPLPLKTAIGSAVAGLWRIVLLPIDTSKTAMQVEGKEGLDRLINRVKETGPSPLYQGALASASATAAGHFPWFFTYNFLNEQIPMVTATDDLLLSLFRSAFLGLCASCVSDCCSNSLRVIKTTKQTAGLAVDGNDKLTYPQVVASILETDGWIGLFGRGLQTRLLTNAIQGAAFSVLWKYFQQLGGNV
jgi:Mitochondrial carrier protein